MITVEEATRIIQAHPFKSKKEKVSLMEATRRILAETIHADRDLPPFNRATMDGIAISFSSFERANNQFKIEAIHAAGQPAISLLDTDACIEIMTGAVLPAGTDTVIRYEDIKIVDGLATLTTKEINVGDNIHAQGADAKQNSVLLEPGIILSTSEIALLAAVGKNSVEVFAFPRTAIISTGDELVEINEIPFPHQIRRSNAYALAASLLEMKCPANLFHITDDKDILKEKLKAIFDDHDLIILSGGVSKGKFDFVPQVLESLGIKKLFHTVSQKPGKPFWFGASGAHTVFALPGNPVSTYMCFFRYIKPWLLKSFGPDAEFPKARLATDYIFRLPLTFFLQVKIRNENGALMAYPETGGGSGNFANLKDVDGFLELPAGISDFKASEVFSFIPFR